jgi:type I restriction enzyme R subunit
VEQCAGRWESGKSMLICIDKLTCARMYQRIMPRWQEKLAGVNALIKEKQVEIRVCNDDSRRDALAKEITRLRGQSKWMEETIIEIIISEAQNEVADFKKWNFDIIPHRARMKQGFEIGDKRVEVDTAFKTPEHPFRVAIVCAMWLTGFDVECLSTLYIDKPMKAHTLMQAIARANRVYPGKDFGLIVDYNVMLKSLREALAQYALGDEEGGGGEEVVAPIEERVQALHEAIQETEGHLRGLGFEPTRLIGAKGFTRIQGLADAVEAVYTSDETKRRFEIMARQVFIRFKALIMEPTSFRYAERHDNIEAIYKKLEERRDTADVTELVKELHRIVNEAIRTDPGFAIAEDAPVYDLSKIDFERLRDEFAKRVLRKATTLQDIRQIVEDKLARMLERNPQRMDYYRRYSEIIADYNREKDRVTIEETFAKLLDLANSLDAEQHRAVIEGLSEDELALFDLLKKENLGKADRERVKLASRSLLDSVRKLIAPLERWTEKEQTRAEVEVFILDHVFQELPTPPFTSEEKQAVSRRVYQHIWQQSARGMLAA